MACPSQHHHALRVLCRVPITGNLRSTDQRGFFNLGGRFPPFRSPAMDTSDFEDMLFSDFDLQTAPDDALSEDTDDELLFATSREETLLWGISNSSDSTLPTASTTLDSQEERQHYQTNLTQRPIRDRYINLRS